jgi:hypothetical protein
VPDASHDKLSYTRGALDKIRAKYDKLTHEQLLDLVCSLTKNYVVEQTIPFDLPLPERTEEGRAAASDDAPAEPLPDNLGDAEPEERAAPRVPPHERFSQLMSALKKRAALPQLEHFAIEEGKVILRVDNQKVTFGERTTVEFVPSQGRPRRPSGERPAAIEGPPAAPGIPAPAAPASPAADQLPGARQGLPGGDGRTRQGSAAPFGAPPAPSRAPGVPRPAPRGAPSAPAPPPTEKGKNEDDSDVGHIVERFKRLDLD